MIRELVDQEQTLSEKKRLMKKMLFKILNKINKFVLPRYSHKDPSKLSKLQQAVVAYRYYTLIRALD